MRQVVIVVLLAGCTVGPDYQRPEMALPQQYPEPSTGSASVVASNWWTLYRDATLDELIANGRSQRS